VSYVAERLADLRRHLDHLEELRPRVAGPDNLRADLSLANDVRYSLLIACQRVIDLAAELSTRRGLRFEDFQEAVRNLAIYEEFPDALIRRLEPLPELRNHLIYGVGDLERVTDLLGKLDGVERFAQGVGRLVLKKA
jgi:uncharacterized protein YutE (UPF0331/DUF86 family)